MSKSQHHPADFLLTTPWISEAGFAACWSGRGLGSLGLVLGNAARNHVELYRWRECDSVIIYIYILIFIYWYYIVLAIWQNHVWMMFDVWITCRSITSLVMSRVISGTRCPKGPPHHWRFGYFRAAEPGNVGGPRSCIMIHWYTL